MKYVGNMVEDNFDIDDYIYEYEDFIKYVHEKN